MLQRLVSRSPDLSRLRAEGYDIAMSKSGHLLVRSVPYVDAAKKIKHGTIAMALDVAGESTSAPQTHVAYFVGDCPCDENGAVLPGVSANANQAVGDGLAPNHQISRKPTMGPPPSGFHDYYEKVTTCVAIVSGPAQAIDPKVTAKTHPVVVPDEQGSVFEYLDTAETKAGIFNANARLEGKKVAIVGVGGTGSYVLDLVAKTPVSEIHIIDDDVFLNHNAFRCPGAAALADLQAKQKKVELLRGVYSRMRKGVTAHACFLASSNVDLLRGMDFVFLCIDKGEDKGVIVAKLEEWGASFIDVGMGVQLGDGDTLGGIVTVTTSTPKVRDEFRKRVSLTGGAPKDEYSKNVQIAELNALNASLAVIKWKKLVGYYDDMTREHWCAYTLRTNHMVSEGGID